MPLNEPLLQRLRHCTTLPTPPGVAVRLIDLANDSGVNLMQIAECVALDPALSAKLLRVANSPLYNTHRAANNVRQAVSLLGTHTAITVALSFSLTRNLKGNGAFEEQSEFWKRAILSALACRILAQRFGLNPDDLLIAGLLQDIGMLAMGTALKEEYYSLLNATKHDELLNAEREKFGSGHDEVGYWLLKKWQLPEHLARACLVSHTASLSEETFLIHDKCIAVSGYFAEAFCHPRDEDHVLRAAEAARSRLGMDPYMTTSILQEMGAQVREVEELFDTSLTDSVDIDGLLGEAKEIIMIAGMGRMRELEERAYRDALTGAHSRSYFDETFRQEFSAASRHGWPLSLAFIDIDHFKRINDTYGHAAGDSVLVTLSRLISMQVRHGDIFARYGGEEFVLVLPGTAAEAAMAVLARIKETIEDFAHSIKDESIQMTVSIGLSTHMEEGFIYVTSEDMLQAADSALYAAKRSGRNRIVKALTLV
jgi:diguanylate cyclase (GGDEF)-like protein